VKFEIKLPQLTWLDDCCSEIQVLIILKNLAEIGVEKENTGGWDDENFIDFGRCRREMMRGCLIRVVPKRIFFFVLFQNFFERCVYGSQ
jgi:hypothetical protein